MNGLTHIEQTFTALKQQGRAALMPYFTLGYPTPRASLEVVEALACSGADLIELGLPFSDPLADGPTIQRSTQIALEQGMTLRKCLEQVVQIRARGVRQPLLLMGYANPLLAYGPDRFAADARAAGADGLIIPDLPIEEAESVEAACDANGLALIYIASPASTDQRITVLAEHTRGFLYLTSLNGVTGARSDLAPGLAEFIQRVRAVVRAPLAVGFGISTPEQARAVAGLADGVIIGSALIRAVGDGKDPAEAAAAAAGKFLTAVRAAMEPAYPMEGA